MNKRGKGQRQQTNGLDTRVFLDGLELRLVEPDGIAFDDFVFELDFDS